MVPNDGGAVNETRPLTAVLHYVRYLGGPESQTVYSYEDFCGECFHHLDDPFHYPKYPEDLEKDNNEQFGNSWHGRDDRELEHFSFCPWCGAAFEDEWWKDQPIQNERAIDHFQNPGTHKGDTHEFRGSGQNCMAGHWLATTGSEVCWCDPEIDPGIMGCVIRHKDKDYEAEMIDRAEKAQDSGEGGIAHEH